MDRTFINLIGDAIYDLILDHDNITNNIIRYMQYYLLEQLDLDIKQLVQLYLSYNHKFRVGELIIIKNRYLNVPLRRDVRCRLWWLPPGMR